MDMNQTPAADTNYHVPLLVISSWLGQGQGYKIVSTEMVLNT